MAVIDGLILKCRCVAITEALQRQALEQVHVNPMEIEKTKHFNMVINVLARHE